MSGLPVALNSTYTGQKVAHRIQQRPKYKTNTRIPWYQTNPMIRFWISTSAHIVVVIDNTVANPSLSRPLSFSAYFDEAPPPVDTQGTAVFISLSFRAYRWEKL